MTVYTAARHGKREAEIRLLSTNYSFHPKKVLSVVTVVLNILISSIKTVLSAA